MLLLLSWESRVHLFRVFSKWNFKSIDYFLESFSFFYFQSYFFDQFNEYLIFTRRKYLIIFFISRIRNTSQFRIQKNSRKDFDERIQRLCEDFCDQADESKRGRFFVTPSSKIFVDFWVIHIPEFAFKCTLIAKVLLQKSSKQISKHT